MKPELLAACMGGIPVSRAVLWAPYIEDACSCYDISTPLRQAAFLAQAAHESGGLIITRENMNYSAKGLRETFPTHFTEEEALAYARQPVKIANKAYAGRMGNGDEASGDGYFYRGGGIFQLTGKADYLACGKDIGLDLFNHPELVTGYVGASMAAGWEWARGHFNKFADAGDFDHITRLLNGGTNGMASRQAYYKSCKSALGLS